MKEFTNFNYRLINANVCKKFGKTRSALLLQKFLYVAVIGGELAVVKYDRFLDRIGKRDGGD